MSSSSKRSRMRRKSDSRSSSRLTATARSSSIDARCRAAASSACRRSRTCSASRRGRRGATPSATRSRHRSTCSPAAGASTTAQPWISGAGSICPCHVAGDRGSPREPRLPCEQVSELLPTSLTARLDAEPIRLVFEYAAQRLGLDDGEQELVLRLSNARLRESATGRRRIRNAELEVLAARPAPPFQRPS